MWDWNKDEDDGNRGGAVTDEDLSDFLGFYGSVFKIK